jgi:hypothetical protein
MHRTNLPIRHEEMKISESFEGPNSSLRKAFDNAVVTDKHNFEPTCKCEKDGFQGAVWTGDCPLHAHEEVSEGWEKEFVEKGADLEHTRWAKWQAYLHSKCVEHENGKGEWVCFPAELYKRWERQINTPYAELSEAEKESDREQVRPYLPLISHTIDSAVREERTKLRIGDLRQWLNEDRITDKKFVTNEEIEIMLGIRALLTHDE